MSSPTRKRAGSTSKADTQPSLFKFFKKQQTSSSRSAPSSGTIPTIDPSLQSRESQNTREVATATLSSASSSYADTPVPLPSEDHLPLPRETEAAAAAIRETISSEPHQPLASEIPPKETNKQNIYFQQKWFNTWK